MTGQDRQRRVFGAFAELLSYPVSDPAPAARRCRELLSGRSADALGAFVSRAERARPHEMEEAYSSTFDLDPSCAPYVGHHLAGETPKRGIFMARLADAYREDGFEGGAPSGELPDHLAVVLRYLAAVPSGARRQALLEDALVPALDRMLAALPDPESVYRPVLAALREEVNP
ncbi:MAG TPA: nitrate reductase molybdenum cofactor assembly chaperone [Anaeromyxobacteraceae bacterium]|nr:nitrate reductase molybdenum cofactor assembly chaperone [Anaeromyxobacteraceae bacterium]